MRLDKAALVFSKSNIYSLILILNIPIPILKYIVIIMETSYLTETVSEGLPYNLADNAREAEKRGPLKFQPMKRMNMLYSN